MKKSILFLLDNPFTNDRRVLCEATSLVKSGYDVTLCAVEQNGLPQNEIMNGISVQRIFKKDIFDTKKPQSFDYYANTILRDFSFSVVHAHDQTMLHLGTKIKKKKKEIILIYDSHELFHEWPLNLSNFKNGLIWVKSFVVRKYQVFREKRNSRYVDYIITVNNSLAKILANYMKPKQQVLVIRNLPQCEKEFKKTNILREKFNIPDEKKILVYIGANIYRHSINIEQVFEEISEQKDIVIVIISAFNQNTQNVMSYVQEKKYNHVLFHDLIKSNEITSFLSSADVGIVSTWNKRNKSYWYALGNKLFEYIQAGIPVLTTRQPEYLGVIEKYKCGVCVNPDQKNAYLNGLRVILDSYDEYVKNTQKAARLLCWEHEEQVFIDFYKSLGND